MYEWMMNVRNRKQKCNLRQEFRVQIFIIFL